MSYSPLGPEWHLSPDGVDIVTENGSVKDSKTMLKIALDSDLKRIGKAALNTELTKSEVGKIVLQIQKIRNISAPKAREDSQAAPRMLKLTLTDGESYVQAIEFMPITSISREKTAPGTKVLIKGAKVVSDYLLITPQNFSVLGGQVEHLHEKWLLAKSVQKNHLAVTNTGAPPWVAFGFKVSSAIQDIQFKSLEKEKEGPTNSEFEQQRKDAIAEASTGAVRKTFGGRVKQNVQPVQNNNRQGRDNDRGRRNKFTSKDDGGDVEKLQRPSENVSLFSFLEDKLPIAEKPVAISKPDYRQEPKKDVKNYSSNKFVPPTGNAHFNNQPAKHSENKSKYPPNDYNREDNRNNQQRNNKFNSQDGYNQNRYSQNSYNGQQRNAKPQQPTQKVPNQQHSKTNTESKDNLPQNNSDMHNLANNLSKMSVSNEFASRSLRQHLNLGNVPAKKPAENSTTSLRIGDQCMAKYWEDGKFYPATITAATEKTYAVQFKGYGNIEEVLKRDCFTSSASFNHQQSQTNNREHKKFSGSSMEFRGRRGQQQ